jgi:flagellar hook protein FlgE
MLDSIYIGMTGLLGFSKGLKTIADNTANMNTPGFKESSLQFTDLFYSSGNMSGGSGSGQYGFGLGTAGTTLNFKQGELRNTGNDLDMAVDGTGLFILKDASGNIHYTRAGQFKFNTDGILVNKTDKSTVMGLDPSGNLVPITIAGLQSSAPKATGTVKFSGNISSTATTPTSATATVLDSAGGTHTLTLQFTNTGSSTSTSFNVSILDGTTPVGSGLIQFVSGSIVPATAQVTLTYTPSGSAPIPLTLDFGTDVTAFAATSTLTMSSQNGIASGSLTKATFDESGTLVLSYSNGQSVKGAQLALGRFDTLDALTAVGGNLFDANNASAWHTGVAGQGAFGAVKAGVIEISNVDLSQEFSDLVIMQRGYQSSSQIISTANEMMQELFTMGGK